MNRIITLTFGPHVSMDEVAQTLQLARMAGEALHGPERMSLEAHAEVSAEHRTVTIDMFTPCGRDLATLFLGFCRREFGSVSISSQNGGQS